MRFEMKMPDLATTDSEIRIVRWLIEPGQKVERGQMLVEVETDKATMEVESVASGVLQEVLCQPGTEVGVGDAVAVLEVDSAPGVPVSPSASASPPPVPASTSPVSTTPAALSAGKPVGMFARNRAAAAAVSEAVTRGTTLSLAQRTAARRLQESKQTVPHFYLQTSFDASAIARRRADAKPTNLAWDAFFVRAVARALQRLDRFCCRLDGERLVRIDSDAIGVAVDDAGDLYVIPIASPLSKTVQQISDEIRSGLQRLQSGDAEARKIRPALMTITNLGVCNVESFIPIINPPEAAILGVGKVMPVPVAHDDGRIGIQRRCTLTLSVDHRVASGRYAGDFLGEIVRELENLEGDEN